MTIIIVVLLTADSCQGSLSCVGKQFSSVNQYTTLGCTITGSYYGVYWYVGESRDSIIRYINGQKAGSEYQSGKLDIASNGSMIINNVSVNDEGTYRVMVVWSEGGDDSAHVHLTVIVPSSRDAPEIDRCNDGESCVFCIYESVTLECIMDGRPVVDLRWYNITSGIPLANQNFNSSLSFPTYISSSTIELHLGYHEIIEIACVPSGLAVTLPDSVVRNTSVLLITPSDPYIEFSKTHYVNMNETDAEPKVLGHETSETVAWIQQTSNIHYSYQAPMCKLALGWSENGLLTLNGNSIDLKGIYTQVVKHNREVFERNVYEVHQVMAPTLTPSIKECLSQHSRNCNIQVDGEGNLTWSLLFSRPPYTPKWTVEPSGPFITQSSSWRSCGPEICQTFITISFELTDTSVATFTCQVTVPWNKMPLNSTIKVFNTQSSGHEARKPNYGTPFAVMLVLLIVPLS